MNGNLNPYLRLLIFIGRSGIRLVPVDNESDTIM
jgi:hypothetical protein